MSQSPPNPPPPEPEPPSAPAEVAPPRPPPAQPPPSAPPIAVQAPLWPARTELWIFWLKLRLTLGVLVVLIAAGLMLWFQMEVLLLGFTGVLLAIFLFTVSDWVARWTHVWYWLALLVVCLVLLAATAGGVWLLADQIAPQIRTLREQLPEAWQTVKSYMEQNPAGAWVLDQAGAGVETLQDGTVQQREVISKGLGYLSSFGLVLTHALVVLFVGLFGAITPSLYVRGMLRLVPMRRRQRAREVLQALRRLLWWWIVGQLIAMVFIGVATSVALWVMGIPLALALGVIAAVLNFIPNFGPILATIPAGLVALMQGPAALVWVIIIYIIIQAVQNHVVMPVTMQAAVELPASILMLAQVFMWYWAGLLGLALSPALAAVVIKLVQMLYLEDYLGDPMRRDWSFWPEGAEESPEKGGG